MGGILCMMGWHRVKRYDNLTGYGPHLGCAHCGKLLGMLKEDS